MHHALVSSVASYNQICYCPDSMLLLKLKTNLKKCACNAFIERAVFSDELHFECDPINGRQYYLSSLRCDLHVVCKFQNPQIHFSI